MARRNVVVLEDQALVFVVRKDGEPGLFMAEGVEKPHAIALFEMMAGQLRADLGLPPGVTDGRDLSKGPIDGD